MIRARVLTSAAASGPVLRLDAPLSFWGAFDPATGVILDVHHPQRGAIVTGRILLMHESKGSGSAPGAIAEAIRRGTAPAAIVLVTPDINLAVGAEVAATLYGRHMAVLAVTGTEMESLRHARACRISADGEIAVETV